MSLAQHIVGFLAVLLSGLLFSAPSAALSNSAVSTGDVNVNQNFEPIIDTSDYLTTCGDYQRISNSPALQRISRNWQRCYAYTSATLATMKDIERTAIVKQFCVPNNISPEYTMDLTIKYAKKIPETQKENPAKIMLEALALRYPC